MKTKVRITKDYEYVRPTSILSTGFESWEYPEYRENVIAGTILEFRSKKDARAFVVATGEDKAEII